MKQYKLIKTYPGSPKLGEIWGEDTKIKGLLLSDSKNEEAEIKSKIESFPEHWEEIIEKEYEILSYSDRENNICKLKWDEIDWKQKYVKNNLHIFKIHSIKRLLDGEVFTVGDLINYKDIFYTNLKIKSIQLFDGKILIHKDCTMNTNDLSEINHIKKRLFKTEDGVDIFKGDNYVKVNNHSNYSLVTGFIAEGAQDNYTGLKFSTKEKAEEYIIMNKPCLSINQICPIIGKCNNTTYIDLNELTKQLQNFVKSKL